MNSSQKIIGLFVDQRFGRFVKQSNQCLRGDGKSFVLSPKPPPPNRLHGLGNRGRLSGRRPCQKSWMPGNMRTPELSILCELFGGFVVPHSYRDATANECRPFENMKFIRTCEALRNSAWFRACRPPGGLRRMSHNPVCGQRWKGDRRRIRLRLGIPAGME